MYLLCNVDCPIIDRSRSIISWPLLLKWLRNAQLYKELIISVSLMTCTAWSKSDFIDNLQASFIVVVLYWLAHLPFHQRYSSVIQTVQQEHITDLTFFSSLHFGGLKTCMFSSKHKVVMNKAQEPTGVRNHLGQSIKMNKLSTHAITKLLTSCMQKK
jgi:hypothetical protein